MRRNIHFLAFTAMALAFGPACKTMQKQDSGLSEVGGGAPQCEEAAKRMKERLANETKEDFLERTREANRFLAEQGACLACVAVEIGASEAGPTATQVLKPFGSGENINYEAGDTKLATLNDPAIDTASGEIVEAKSIPAERAVRVSKGTRLNRVLDMYVMSAQNPAKVDAVKNAVTAMEADFVEEMKTMNPADIAKTRYVEVRIRLAGLKSALGITNDSQARNEFNTLKNQMSSLPGVQGAEFQGRMTGAFSRVSADLQMFGKNAGLANEYIASANPGQQANVPLFVAEAGRAFVLQASRVGDGVSIERAAKLIQTSASALDAAPGEKAAKITADADFNRAVETIRSASRIAEYDAEKFREVREATRVAMDRIMKARELKAEVVDRMRYIK